jgi:hypothetical protein
LWKNSATEESILTIPFTDAQNRLRIHATKVRTVVTPGEMLTCGGRRGRTCVENIPYLEFSQGLHLKIYSSAHLSPVLNISSITFNNYCFNYIFMSSVFLSFSYHCN